MKKSKYSTSILALAHLRHNSNALIILSALLCFLHKGSNIPRRYTWIWKPCLSSVHWKKRKEHGYMSIVNIIAQPGIFLDAWSQLVTERLDKICFDNRRLQDFKISLSWVKHLENCLSLMRYWIIKRLHFTLNSHFSPSIWEDIPANIFAPKNHLESFPDASKSHKTSTYLSDLAYFRQFSNW